MRAKEKPSGGDTLGFFVGSFKLPTFYCIDHKNQ